MRRPPLTVITICRKEETPFSFNEKVLLYGRVMTLINCLNLSSNTSCLLADCNTWNVLTYSQPVILTMLVLVHLSSFGLSMYWFQLSVNNLAFTVKCPKKWFQFGNFSFLLKSIFNKIMPVHMSCCTREDFANMSRHVLVLATIYLLIQ